MKHLDTNVIIHYLRGDPSVITHLQREKRASIAISAVTLYELHYGSLRAGKRRTGLDHVLATLTVIPFDAAASSEAARVRFELEKQGQSIGPMDLLIAGTAVSRGAVLVTNNIREFSRVPGLRFEDWRAVLKDA